MNGETYLVVRTRQKSSPSCEVSVTSINELPGLGELIFSADVIHWVGKFRHDLNDVSGGTNAPTGAPGSISGRQIGIIFCVLLLVSVASFPATTAPLSSMSFRCTASTSRTWTTAASFVTRTWATSSPGRAPSPRAATTLSSVRTTASTAAGVHPFDFSLFSVHFKNTCASLRAGTEHKNVGSARTYFEASTRTRGMLGNGQQAIRWEGTPKDGSQISR